MFGRKMALLAAVCGLLAQGSVIAQSYPTKPMRLIEAGGSGGLADIMARGFGQAMSQVLAACRT